MAASIQFREPISDGIVTLRRLRVEDAPAYAAAYRDDVSLGRLLGTESDPSESEIRERISGQDERAAAGRNIELAAADPGTDGFWGAVVLHSFDWRSRRNVTMPSLIGSRNWIDAAMTPFPT